MEIWDIWYPGGGPQGISLARASIDPAEVVLLHAAPNNLRVEVRDDGGQRVAFGDRLKLDGDYFPMTRLVREGGGIRREDGWPGADDIGGW